MIFFCCAHKLKHLKKALTLQSPPFRLFALTLSLHLFFIGSIGAQTVVPFSFTGSAQSFTVPPCVNTLHIKAWGGGGSGGGTDDFNGAGGGGGGFVQCDLAVVPGQVLTIIVGGGGSAGTGCVTAAGGGAGGWGNGLVDGAAGGDAGGQGCSGGGGGGGGAAAIFNGATPLIVAAGAGGGSGGGQFSSGAIGGGGGQNGNSVAGSCTTPGIAGGSGNGQGTAGATKGFFADGGGGGGGGGGANGGTGGSIAGGCDCGACGGGGGASFSSGTVVVITNGNNQTPGNNADPDLPAGDAIGGAGSSNGGNGFLQISYPASAVPPTTSITSFTNLACATGTTGSITASATGGTAPLTYSWTPGGQTTATATNLAPGTYTVTVTDQTGCQSSNTQTLTAPPPLTTSTSGVQTSCHSKCDGTLICIPSGGQSPYTYSWRGVCASPSCNNVCAGTYSLTITDANGCIKNDSVVVTEPPALAITFSSKTAFCNKSDGSATATVTGGTGVPTYTWSPVLPGSSTATYANLPPGIYTLTVHDAKGCPDTNTVTVTNIPGVAASIPASKNPSCFNGSNGTATAMATAGTPGYTYSWSPAPGGGQGTSTVVGLAAGSYTCLITDSSGCLSQAAVLLKQPTPVSVTPVGGPSICVSQCTPLTATGAGGTPGYTYSWMLNGTACTSPACPLTSTTYTVLAIDSNACTSIPKTVLITVRPPLQVVAVPGNSVCPGSSETLSAMATGGTSTYTYSWHPTTGLNVTVGANPVASPATTTTYTVVVSDNCTQPSDSTTVTVTLYPAPVPQIFGTDTAGCAPLCVNFSEALLPSCSGALWDYGDGKTGSGCGPGTHCYTTPGLYPVGVHFTDANGCKTFLSKQNWINVYPLPKTLFSASPQPTTILDPQVFFLNKTGDSSCTWNWKFGDPGADSSTLMNPSFTYLDTGCYPVRLVAKNTLGCTDTSRLEVCIDPLFTFYAPNSFTPNGDGINDIWMPKGQGIDGNNYALTIYDRWGNLIFSTYTWGEGWDGKVNNAPIGAQIDDYVWRVDVKDFSRQNHTFKGIVSIIR